MFRSSRRYANSPEISATMAYRASLQVFQTTRGGGSLEANGSEPLNSYNYNDFMDRAATQGYWKPRFAAWPRGGYTRKEAMKRCVTGKLEVTPGSYEWKARFDKQGHLRDDAPERLARLESSRAPSESSNVALCTNVTARFMDPEARIFDKEATFKADLRDRFLRWSKVHYPVNASEPPSSHRSALSVSSHRDSPQASSASWEVISTPLSSSSVPSQNDAFTARVFARGTPDHLRKKVPVLPAPYFPEVGRRDGSLLSAARVPVVRSDTNAHTHVAHLRPYSKPWNNPVLYFEP